MYTDRRPNRMERVLADIERDALVLPETRWPHASTRAPSKFEPLNAGPPPDSAYRTTLATELRRASLEDEQELRRAVQQARRKEDEERAARQKRIGAEVAAVSRARARAACTRASAPALTLRGWLHLPSTSRAARPGRCSSRRT